MSTLFAHPERGPTRGLLGGALKSEAGVVSKFPPRHGLWTKLGAADIAPGPPTSVFLANIAPWAPAAPTFVHIRASSADFGATFRPPPAPDLRCRRRCVARHMHRKGTPSEWRRAATWMAAWDRNSPMGSPRRGRRPSGAWAPRARGVAGARQQRGNEAQPESDAQLPARARGHRRHRRGRRCHATRSGQKAPRAPPRARARTRQHVEGVGVGVRASLLLNGPRRRPHGRVGPSTAEPLRARPRASRSASYGAHALGRPFDYSTPACACRSCPKVAEKLSSNCSGGRNLAKPAGRSWPTSADVGHYFGRCWTISTNTSATFGYP